MVAVGGLGNVYGAVVGTVAILCLEHRLRDLGTHERHCSAGTCPHRRRASSRSVSSVVILIVVMLFFPSGLLPALLDALRGVWRRLKLDARF